jgi:hypothetical protein
LHGAHCPANGTMKRYFAYLSTTRIKNRILTSPATFERRPTQRK